jgi:hypothetical protein
MESIIRKEDAEILLLEHSRIMEGFHKALETELLYAPLKHAITHKNGEWVIDRIKTAKEIRLQATIDTLNQLFRHKIEWLFKEN